MHTGNRVGQGRVELPTSRLSGVRSNHLSYWPGQVALARAFGPMGRAGACLLPGPRVPLNGAPRSLETEPYARQSRVGLDCLRLLKGERMTP
jgi:hypothetical protein